MRPARGFYGWNRQNIGAIGLPVFAKATGNEPGALYQWDIIETRLFVADWFRKNPSRLRPYLLAGFGFNLNSASLAGGQANFGGGVQYQINETVYLGAEATYRHLFLKNDISNLAMAATVGFRF